MRSRIVKCLSAGILLCATAVFISPQGANAGYADFWKYVAIDQNPINSTAGADFLASACAGGVRGYDPYGEPEWGNGAQFGSPNGPCTIGFSFPTPEANKVVSVAWMSRSGMQCDVDNPSSPYGTTGLIAYAHCPNPDDSQYWIGTGNSGFFKGVYCIAADSCGYGYTTIGSIGSWSE